MTPRTTPAKVPVIAEWPLKLAQLYNGLTEVQREITTWKISTSPELRWAFGRQSLCEHPEERISHTIAPPSATRGRLLLALDSFIAAAKPVHPEIGHPELRRSVGDTIEVAERLRKNLIMINQLTRDVPRLNADSREDRDVIKGLEHAGKLHVPLTTSFSVAQEWLKAELKDVDFGFGLGAIPTQAGLGHVSHIELPVIEPVYPNVEPDLSAIPDACSSQLRTPRSQ